MRYAYYEKGITSEMFRFRVRHSLCINDLCEMYFAELSVTKLNAA